tara:strand:- start:256 stop:1182 length:927 start_codon:yes stop_codon:yes gene_type:complete
MIDYSLKLFSYTDLLNNFVTLDNKNLLPSSILLTGQEGIGKTNFSFHLINYLFSKEEINKYNILENKIYENNRSHNLVKNLTHPNFYYISKNEGKKNIDIDQIRNMIAFLNKSSFDNNRKIILIDGAEDLNASSSNALLKSLEESINKNIFLLTHNINKNILDTIKSRCIIYKLNYNYSNNDKILSYYFETDLYKNLNDDFKYTRLSPKFLIQHIKFVHDNNLDLMSITALDTIKYILDNKLYKKDIFIYSFFQSYIEIYFTKMYAKTKNNKYYIDLLKIISENNDINKYNLDLETFFIKFENMYLNN